MLGATIGTAILPGLGAAIGRAVGVVAPHTADSLYIHTVLESQGSEGVAEVAEPHLG